MVHIFDNAASPAQRAELAAWVQKLFQQGLLVANGLGPHRFHRNIAELPWVHPALLELRGALVERFGLWRFRTDPAYGDMVSFHEPGGFIHPHLDPYVEGERHVRINVIVHHPVAGGAPVLDGQELRVAPGQGWFFRPYRVMHASTPVTGDQPRINLSFGWSVPPSYCIPGEVRRGGAQIVEELFAAIGQGDEAALRRLLATDVVVRFPGTGRFAGEHLGPDAVLALWARQRRYLAGRALELDTIDMLEGEGHVIAYTRGRAEGFGAWETLNLYRLRDRLIVEASPIVRGLEAFDGFWSSPDLPDQ
jgi:hypothetical protein